MRSLTGFFLVFFALAASAASLYDDFLAAR